MPSKRRTNLGEARAAQRAAGKKVSRLESLGNRIRRDELDPRQSWQAVERMSETERRSYIRKLNKFNDRGTQFVPGISGTPLPKNRVQEYLRLQEANNAAVAARREQVEAFGNLPQQDQSGVGRFDALSKTRKTGVAGPIHQTIERRPGWITSPKELEVLIDQMRRKVEPGLLVKGINRRLNSVEAMLKNIGASDLMNEIRGGTGIDKEGNEYHIRGMSADEVEVLLDYTTFVEVMRDRFGSGEDARKNVQKQDRNHFENYHEDKAAVQRANLEEIINWVKDHSGNESTTTGSPTDSEPFVRRAPRSRRKK